VQGIDRAARVPIDNLSQLLVGAAEARAAFPGRPLHDVRPVARTAGKGGYDYYSIIPQLELIRGQKDFDGKDTYSAMLVQRIG
jgi:hypothetical protein